MTAEKSYNFLPGQQQKALNKSQARETPKAEIFATGCSRRRVYFFFFFCPLPSSQKDNILIIFGHRNYEIMGKRGEVWGGIYY